MVEIAIVDEHGHLIRQLDGKLARAFSKVLSKYRADTSSCCLRFVDPYGDTTFNRLQSEFLLHELSAVAEHGMNSEAQGGIDAVRGLAEEVVAGVHLYLKFSGD